MRASGSCTGMGHFLGSMLGISLRLLLEQVAGGLARVRLKVAVHSPALHRLVKVHLMPVKVRAVHAGKLRLAAHGEAATAAHAGAVDHDGVHGDGRF